MPFTYNFELANDAISVYRDSELFKTFSAGTRAVAWADGNILVVKPLEDDRMEFFLKEAGQQENTFEINGVVVGSTGVDLNDLAQRIVGEVFLEASGSGGVQSVTGPTVDNTDPNNPVVNAGLGLIDTTTGNDSTQELLIKGARFGAASGSAATYAGEGTTTPALNQTSFGHNAAEGNTGQNVIALGYNAAQGNAFNSVRCIGTGAIASADSQTVFGDTSNPIVINHAVIQNTTKSLKVTIGVTDYWIVLATSEPI